MERRAVGTVVSETRTLAKPFGAALGADIEGTDLGALDDATFAEIERAWGQYSVLRFRRQRLSDLDLMRFSRRFGELDRVPIRPAHVADADDPASRVLPEAREYVTVISNERHGGKPIGGLGNYELVWHTDMSYNPKPPSASLLYAIKVPPSGGNTWFCSMYRAYETLPEDVKARIQNLTCIHDASRNSAGELRRGFSDIADPRQTVGARHPLLRTHPATGRPALFLGRRRNAYIPELSLEDSEALLDRLWSHATQPEFCWAQTWQDNDLIIWDNRCVMHRRDPFDDRHERVMHRTQVCGDTPFCAAPGSAARS
jgi:taurine dioxygenase